MTSIDFKSKAEQLLNKLESSKNKIDKMNAIEHTLKNMYQVGHIEASFNLMTKEE